MPKKKKIDKIEEEELSIIENYDSETIVLNNEQDNVKDINDIEVNEKPIVYHNNPDLNYILKAYNENPSKPNFSKYGYVVSIIKKQNKVFLEWNNKKIEV